MRGIVRWMAMAIALMMLLVCVGCAPEPRDERLSIDYAIEQLERQANEEDIIYIRNLLLLEHYTPLYADETLFAALRLSEWEENEVPVMAENGKPHEPFTKEYEHQNRYRFLLEHTGESSFYLEIGDRYGAILRADYRDGVKENGVKYRESFYHSAVCFTLPQSEEGEMVEALYVLSNRYIDETGWTSID